MKFKNVRKQYEANEFVKEYKKNDTDVGSSQVQIARLSFCINKITEHLKKNRKDFHSTLGLRKMTSQRKKLLKFLERKNPEEFQKMKNIFIDKISEKLKKKKDLQEKLKREKERQEKKEIKEQNINYNKIIEKNYFAKNEKLFDKRIEIQEDPTKQRELLKTKKDFKEFQNYLNYEKKTLIKMSEKNKKEKKKQEKKIFEMEQKIIDEKNKQEKKDKNQKQ